MLVDQKNENDEQITRAVLRLNSNVTGLALGLLCGLTLFIATFWLVIKGGPNVGAHLQLLNQYFPGYKVTMAGGFIGLAYGFVTGFIAGWVIAWIYNRLVTWRGR